MPIARSAMEQSHAAHKRDFDARMRGTLPADIKARDYAFVHEEYYIPEGKKRHKLSPVADGFFRVVFVTPSPLSSMSTDDTNTSLTTALSWLQPVHCRHRWVRRLRSPIPRRLHGPCLFHTHIAACLIYQPVRSPHYAALSPAQAYSYRRAPWLRIRRGP